MANIIPTKGNLIASKRSRDLAETGFELMDKKRNILIREIMALIDQAEYLQDQISIVFSEAFKAMRYANISMGGTEHIAQVVPIDDSLSILTRSVMGVEIPSIQINKGRNESLDIPYGLAGTTSALDDAYVKFSRVKALIHDLAETENAIYRLAYTIRKTQKRANALKNIVIPNLDETIETISSFLEEKEREEFVRLKVIKSGKK